MKNLVIIGVVLSFILVSSFTVKNSKTILTKEQLGEKLFFDPILSSDNTISCASCHNPEFAFSDTVTLSKGVGGKLTKRNVPTAMNMSERSHYFYDGRAATLEEQALGPIQNPDEMNLTIETAIERLNKNEFYEKAFHQIYGAKPSKENLSNALASFERTLETSNCDYDLFIKKKENKFSEAALRGRNIFITKGKCFDCHSGTDFTTDEFKNIGLYNGTTLNDKGRYEISKDVKDLGAFKIPGLRNVEVTAPYMHNGMFKTLEEVVAYYNNPDSLSSNSINRDTSIKRLFLTKNEEADLVVFLKSLTDKRFKK